jgi:hypothetical protein
MAVVAPEQLVNRFWHRWHAYDSFCNSDDFLAANAFFGPTLMPPAPDPFAVATQSKRCWEKEAGAWQHEVKTMKTVLMSVVLQSGAFD